MSAVVLDPCCGSRMMWFDKEDQRALFGDIRSEEHTLCDGRALNITPQIAMDFRAMPFADGTFQLIAFDPPHLRKVGLSAWLGRSMESWGRTGATTWPRASRSASACSSRAVS